ncbi:Protein lifeguard 1, partial [Stegodyphus mimosarum]
MAQVPPYPGTQVPPYPGFNPYVAGGASYPQNPGQQYPYPQQPGQQYPMSTPQIPGQQYPMPTAQIPGQHYPMPSAQIPGQQYPSPPAGSMPGNLDPYGPPPGPIPVHIPADSNVSYKDDRLPGWTGFTDKAIRAAFVRKVYSILMLQLLFSLAVIALFVFHERVNLFVRRHTYLYYVS